MSTNEYSDKKRQLASKLVQDRRRLLDSLTSNRPITTEAIASFEAEFADLVKEYKIAYEQADVIERQEMKKEIKQTKIKRRERHISNT